jgi:hypothetical protein
MVRARELVGTGVKNACVHSCHFHGVCMPPDLPGLYYDPDKKRYFPTASRPAGVPSAKRANKAPETPRAPKVVKGPKTRPLFDVRLAIQSAAVAHASATRRSKARYLLLSALLHGLVADVQRTEKSNALTSPATTPSRIDSSYLDRTSRRYVYV